MRRAHALAAAAHSLLLCTVLAVAGPAQAAIYDCDNPVIKRDRPIDECKGVHRELNTDGSFRRIVPPTLTQEERAQRDQCERDAQSEQAAWYEARRREQTLVKRYPDEAAHKKAREKALDDSRQSVRISEQRVQLLLGERKPLLDELEFYPNKTPPSKLKNALDANDAALEAQRALIQNQQAENVRINKVYDEELERLRKLWRGGSVPKPPVAQCVAAPALRSGFR